MQVLDGKLLSGLIKSQIREKVEAMHVKPHLVAVLVGEDPASQTYVSNKIKSCEEVGFKSTLIRHDSTISEGELLKEIMALNEDRDVHGILVQLPLPKHIDVVSVIETISPAKDVDGFHPVNIGKMTKGIKSFLPATPYGILKLLEHYKIETSGKHCVVIGRSQIVGTPISILLSRDSNPGNATVTLCHSKTADLKNFTLQADIIVAAVGRPNTVTADMVKEGAVIVDVGMNRVADASKKSGFRLVGDADFENVSKKASWITPVPGGVGPMTIACLLLNTLEAVAGKQTF